MRDFEEDVDDIGDGGFKDETIGHREGFWQPRNQGISCILMRCYGKRKGGFRRRGGIKGRKIKRLVLWRSCGMKTLFLLSCFI